MRTSNDWSRKRRKSATIESMPQLKSDALALADFFIPTFVRSAPKCGRNLKSRRARNAARALHHQAPGCEGAPHAGMSGATHESAESRDGRGLPAPSSAVAQTGLRQGLEGDLRPTPRLIQSAFRDLTATQFRNNVYRLYALILERKTNRCPQMRIALQRLLDDQSQPVEPFAHVGVPRRHHTRTPAWIGIIAVTKL